MDERTLRRMPPALRRQRILDQAISLIGQTGYQGFTVQRLAQACGLTNGGLLHYFDSKERLFVAILQERDRREAAIVPTRLERAGASPRTRALRAFHAIVARSVAEPELLRLLVVLQAEAMNRDHPAYDYFQRREGLVLAQFVAILTGQTPDPRGMARVVLGLIAGLEQLWLRAEQAFDLVATCDGALASLLDGAQTARRTQDAFAVP